MSKLEIAQHKILMPLLLKGSDVAAVAPERASLNLALKFTNSVETRKKSSPFQETLSEVFFMF